MDKVIREGAVRVGVDLAKRVIQVHAVDGAGRVLSARALARDVLRAALRGRRGRDRRIARCMTNIRVWLLFAAAMFPRRAPFFWRSWGTSRFPLVGR